MNHLQDKKLVMDGLNLIQQIPSYSIAACFFDPQYRGLPDHLAYSTEDEYQPKRAELPQMNESLIQTFIGEIGLRLKENGYLFLWIDKYHLCEGVRDWFPSTFRPVDLITWDKGTFGNGYRTRRTCEYLLVIQKEPQLTRSWKRSPSIRDTWHESKALGHPHKKPYGLISALISVVTLESEVVLDPAAGSFIVYDACVAQNRRFLGCDLIYGDSIPAQQ